MADIADANTAVTPTDTESAPEQTSPQLQKVHIALPNGSQSEVQLTGREYATELRDGIFDLPGLKFLTCFHFVIDGTVLGPQQQLNDCPGFKAGCVINVVAAPYNKNEIILHLARLQTQIEPSPKDSNLGAILKAVEEEELELKRSRQAQQQQRQQQQQNNSGGKGKGKNKKKKKKKAPTKQLAPISETGEERYTLNACSSNSIVDLRLNRSAEPEKAIFTFKMSSWNPPPPNRQLVGDIMYLKVTLADGTKFQVTASVKGFFVNSIGKDNFDPKPSTDTYPTLPALLTSLRSSFGESLENLLANKYSSNQSPYEVEPVRSLYERKEWLEHASPPTRSQPFLDLLHESIAYTSNRDWNAELQRAREFPNKTMTEALDRDRVLTAIHQDFIDAAVEGAKLIVNGEMQPANPLDVEPLHLYIRNNLFFMHASGDKYDTGAQEVDDDPFAYKLCNSDIIGANIYNGLGIEGLHTVQTALINYRGRHIFAQGIIPGVLDAVDSPLSYGSVDQGKTVKSEENFHKMMLEAAEKLSFAPSRFADETGNEVEIAAPIFTKGVKGCDNRCYAMDFECVTAYDSSGGKRYTIYRPELIRQYVGHLHKLHTNEYRSKVQKIVAEKREERKKLKEKEAADAAAAGTPLSAPTEEEAKKDEEAFIAEVEAIVKDLPKTEFVAPLINPNFNCPNKYGKLIISDEERAEQERLHADIAKYRSEVAIPSVVRDLQSSDFPPDSEKLTATMHSRGVNIRCLGQLSDLLAKMSRPALQNLVFSEMVVRTAKHMFNGFLRETPTDEVSKVAASFLTILIGALGSVSHPAIKTPNNKPVTELSELTELTLYRELFAQIKERFGVSLSVGFVKGSASMRIPILRAFCMQTGIVLNLRRYNLSKPFTTDDIVSIEPIVKSTNPIVTSARNLIETGSQQLMQGKFDVAYDFLQEALQVCQHTCGPMHLLTAVCLQSLATVMAQAGDIPQAISFFQQGLIILERVHGSDRHDVVVAYIKLAELYAGASRSRQALALYKRALYIINLMYDTNNAGAASIHKEIGKTLQNLKMHSAALEHFNRSLEIFESLVGPDTIFSATLSHDMAVSHSFLGRNKEALALEKKNYAFLSSRAGDKDENTVQSGIWLKQFTLKAVQEAREAQKAPQVQSSGDNEEVPLFNRPIPDILKYINGSEKQIGRRPRGPNTFGSRGVAGVFGRKP